MYIHQAPDSRSSASPHRKRSPVVFPYETLVLFIWVSNMSEKIDVWQGTLSLMVLKTLDVLGPQHGYGIARRIEQTSESVLSINHGTLYPVLLKLEQEGSVVSQWGTSDNNRRAKFYCITRSGKKALSAEESAWQQTADIVARFSRLREETA